ncbi:MAG: hypothetical protein K1X88_03745 [Nannocystaceae bacterium]|nr:hypothetical protein [Nannocystaceae bacterium]
MRLFSNDCVRPLPLFALAIGLAGCPDDSNGTGSSGDSSTTNDEDSTTDPSTTVSTTDATMTTAPADSSGSSSDGSSSTGDTTGEDTSSTGTTGTTTTDASSGSSTGGAVCGDGAVAGDEVCDGQDLAGEDCMSQGFAGGRLACLDDCSGFDTSTCAQANDCADQFVAEIGTPAAMGNTVMEDDDLDGSCGSFGGNDLVIEFTAPEDAIYAFDSLGSDFDTEIALFADCAGTEELACNDDAFGTLQSGVTLEMSAGQVVLVMIDGFSGATGDAVLNIYPAPVCGDSVAVAPAELCDGDDLAGVTCASIGLGGATPTCVKTCDGFTVDTCDAPTGYGNCWLAGASACTVEEQCVLDFSGDAVCMEFDCTDVGDCGPALPSGDAPVTCADLGGDGSNECYLSCALGETCPDGMVCSGSFCAWPSPQG